VTRRPVVPDRQTAQVFGVLCIAAGAFLLYDAYEARGHARPFWTRFLPG
jgi:hypothetical protein